MLDNLERKGDILIMRALTGPFKDVALPKLGKKNSQGLKINDNGNSASQRLRTVWWDDVRERGRAGKRVEDGEYRSCVNRDYTLSCSIRWTDN